uniref:G patch domain-containing protein 4 n=1 Tax=Sander lucioperca TaxID=283035 RepID=A0A8C9YP25_SANLU
MADAVPEKSRALKFAEQQLLRHGWEHGKGLGRGENGISEAIKVKVKCGKGGVGHKEGEQFTFHWWDHVFNKASSGLQVESDQSNELTITWYQHNMIRGLFYCLFTAFSYFVGTIFLGAAWWLKAVTFKAYMKAMFRSL